MRRVRGDVGKGGLDLDLDGALFFFFAVIVKGKEGCVWWSGGKG